MWNGCETWQWQLHRRDSEHQGAGQAHNVVWSCAEIFTEISKQYSRILEKYVPLLIKWLLGSIYNEVLLPGDKKANSFVNNMCTKDFSPKYSCEAHLHKSSCSCKSQDMIKTNSYRRIFRTWVNTPEDRISINRANFRCEKWSYFTVNNSASREWRQNWRAALLAKRKWPRNFSRHKLYFDSIRHAC